MTEGPLIAVVNDDTAFLTMMNELLTQEGYRTFVWREGNRAHDAIRQRVPDLVILDIRMEHQETGWQVLELMKLDPETRRIPVIVSSADTRVLDEKRDRLESHGCMVLEKPFDLDELLQMIKFGLDTRQQSG